MASRVAIPASAFLWGSIAPDLPLYALSIGGMIYYPAVYGWTREQAGRHMFDYMYFNDPFWIAAHNTLHAPIVLLVGLTLLWTLRQRPVSRLRWLFWFLAGCLVHTCIDIPCHVDDGPVIFFPFDWHTRFHSPVSYWDPAHYGRQFAIFELSLNVVLLVYLLAPALHRRWAARRTAGPAPNQD